MAPRDKTYRGFLLRFALIFVALALPWPHWQAAWRPVFQFVAEHTLADTNQASEVTVTLLDPPTPQADVRFTLVNRGLLNADGSGPVRELDFAIAQIEMRPLILLFALIFATPIPWRKRARHFAISAFLLQAGILAVLKFCLWRESMELLLTPASSGMTAAATAVRNGLVQYFGLALPFLLWCLFCARHVSPQAGVVLFSTETNLLPRDADCSKIR
jgi:hypothetical protein